MFRFVDALEIESDIQLKIEQKEYQSALQQYLTAKELAGTVLSNSARLQWVFEKFVVVQCDTETDFLLSEITNEKLRIFHGLLSQKHLPKLSLIVYLIGLLKISVSVALVHTIPDNINQHALGLTPTLVRLFVLGQRIFTTQAWKQTSGDTSGQT